MNDNQKAEFKALLTQVFEVYEKHQPSKIVLQAWWQALSRFDYRHIESALADHIASNKFSPKPADIVGQLVSRDGRPTADEAWSTAMKASSEAVTILWTDEIAGALSDGAGDILASGDAIAARMAFRDSYNRRVKEARENHKAVKTWFSYGTDESGRKDAIEQAKAKGLISPDRAVKLLIQHPPKETRPAGKALLELIAEPDTQARHEGIKKIKARLKGAA